MEVEVKLTQQETEDAIRAKVASMILVPESVELTLTDIKFGRGDNALTTASVTIGAASKKSAVYRRPTPGTVNRTVSKPKVVEETTATVSADPEPVQETVAEAEPETTAEVAANEEPPFDMDAAKEEVTEDAPSEEAAAAPKTGSLFASLARK